jgi:hypothetical protein
LSPLSQSAFEEHLTYEVETNYDFVLGVFLTDFSRVLLKQEFELLLEIAQIESRGDVEAEGLKKREDLFQREVTLLLGILNEPIA